MALDALGLTETHERIYRALLRDGSPASIGPADEPALGELEQLGLVERTAGGLHPRPPSMLEELAERIEDDLTARARSVARVRADIAALVAWHDAAAALPSAPSADGGVEVLLDLEIVRQRLDELSFFARQSVYSVQPVRVPTPAARAAAARVDARCLRRGLDVRLIVDRQVASPTDLQPGLRVSSEPLQRMIVIDEEVAVVSVDPETATRGALIVRHPGLVATMVRTFELLWTSASSSAELPAPPAEDDLTLLDHLRAGGTDESIARDLGVSSRQVRRRVARLMETLGAPSRFAAGVLAVQRGWIT